MLSRLGRFGRCIAALGLVASWTVVGRPAAAAQESSLRAERTVDYRPGQAVDISAKVGGVTVQTVEFSERSRTTGGFTTRIIGGTESDTSNTVRAHFLAENPTGSEWSVSFTLEFLDQNGKLIDRAAKKASWEGEVKPTDLDHPMLKYVLPLIAQVRIKMEAKLE